MPQIMITLNQIEAHEPCSDGLGKILAATDLHGGDYGKQFPLSAALETNGLDDTLWALRCLPEHSRLWRKYAVWCAYQVRHLMDDQRSIDALDVAYRHADGLATDDDLSDAGAAAWDAAWSAARDAERDAASWDALWDAKEGPAFAAARDAQKARLATLLDSGEWVPE
jgi:hypothetical protein